MVKKLFAVKMESGEKEIMDFISKNSHLTLARMYAPLIEVNTRHWMGVLAHYRLEQDTGMDLLAYEEIFALPTDRSSASRYKSNTRTARSVPGLYLSLEEHFVDRDVFRFFNEVFDGLSFDNTIRVIGELDYWDISLNVGSNYIDSSPNMRRFDQDLALDLILSVLLDNYFWRTAIGTYRQLNSEWYARRNYIENLKRDISQDYLAELDKPVEAIQLVEPL